MADFYSRVSYTGDGSTDTFTIPFPYFSKTDVFIRVDDTNIGTYEFLTESSIKLPTPPAQGAVVSIYRRTPKNRIIDFQDGSLLNSDTLDADSNQMMFLVQEAADDAQGTVGLTYEDLFDVGLKRLTNVADAIDDTDAVNLRTLMDILHGTWVIEKNGEDAAGVINFKTYTKA